MHNKTKPNSCTESFAVNAAGKEGKNLLRKNIHDKRVIELIKRYLKAGVMENGLLVKTTEGSSQGGPLSPLLANIYLNEYDKKMAGRGVPVIRYADDIVVLVKSPRAAHRYGNSRKGYWRLAGTTTLSRAISNKRLAQAGYYSILDRYESLHLCD